MTDLALHNLKFDFQITLGTPDKLVILDKISFEILKSIEKKGSLNYALTLVGLSYRNGWGKIRKMEKELGFPLILSERGGPEGGRSTLSPEAKKLVRAFDKIHEEIDLSLERYLNSLDSKKKPCHGETSQG